LELSTRAGEELSAPKAIFTNTELAKAGYLKWNALFENKLAGLPGRDEKIEARFYSPSGLQIASSWDEHLVNQAQKTVSFSSVALISEPNLIKPGDYKVKLSLGDQMLAEEHFMVTEDQSAKDIGIPPKPAATETGSPPANLRAALDAEGYTSVQFRIEGDTVDLWGTVPSEFDRMAVQAIVFTTTRIISLQDHIRVQDEYGGP